MDSTIVGLFAAWLVHNVAGPLSSNPLALQKFPLADLHVYLTTDGFLECPMAVCSVRSKISNKENSATLPIVWIVDCLDGNQMTVL